MKVSPIVTMMDYVQGYERGGVHFDFNIFLIHFGCRKSPRENNGVPLPDLLLVSPQQLLCGDVVFSLAGDVQQGSLHYSPLPTLATNRILSAMAQTISRTEPRHYDKLAEVFRDCAADSFHNPEVIGQGRSTVRMFYELTALLLEGKIQTKEEWAKAGLDIIDQIKKDKKAEYKERVTDAKALESFKRNEVVYGFRTGYSPMMQKVHAAVRQEFDTFVNFGLTELLLRKPDLIPERIINALAEEIGVKRTEGVEMNLVKIRPNDPIIARTAASAAVATR